MSDQNEGVLISNEDGVFYIPNDRLAAFKLTDDEAQGVRASVGSDEVSGFAFSAAGSMAVGGELEFAFSGLRLDSISSGDLGSGRIKDIAGGDLGSGR